MSDLTVVIARAHRVERFDQPVGRVQCTCGVWTPSRASEGMLDVQGRHVAEVTEAQVRAQVAAEIGERMQRRPPIGATAADAWTNATERAARIARGESS